MPVRCPASPSVTIKLCKTLCHWVAFSMLLFAASRLHAQPSGAAKNTCTFAEPQFEGSTDISGLKSYISTVADLLKREDFSNLDCLADAARSGKVRFPGGRWKLHNIYIGLTELDRHVTEDDRDEQISHLEHWAHSRPNSITARIALAEVYTSYAWDARGGGLANTVSDSGWKLFGYRLQKARDILENASTLATKCPEWYVAMQDIAKGQDWSAEDMRALFQEAIAFEPEYYYYYTEHANFLLPQWNGEEGDAAAFAASSADLLGGIKGDVLYFHMAIDLGCACNKKTEIDLMSWERIQKGFTATENFHGRSMKSLNFLALMAMRFDDSVAADEAFKQIGDQWDESVWRTREYFDSSKQMAAQMGPLEARSRAQIQEATANGQTVEGAHYEKAVEEKFVNFVQECTQSSDADLQKFEFMVLIDKNGTPQNSWMPRPTNLMGCLEKALFVAQIKKETPFPPPPHDSYWLKLQVDPSTYKATASK
jgi:hypothetical protein